MSEKTAISRSARERRRGIPAPLKSEKTREAILEAALDFLWTQPFRDLTVAQLMEDAGASRPTFYQYFADLHDLMGELLDGLRDDILVAAEPWFVGQGNPLPHLELALSGLVAVCYERGPILRAVADAAVSDAGLERTWRQFLDSFDDAVAARIEQQQEAGYVAQFPARPVAVALNRLDAGLLIEKFGRRPRSNRDDVLAALKRIWVSTLYGEPAQL
jgi:AcrR family transcriptional regulator